MPFSPERSDDAVPPPIEDPIKQIKSHFERDGREVLIVEYDGIHVPPTPVGYEYHIDTVVDDRTIRVFVQVDPENLSPQGNEETFVPPSPPTEEPMVRLRPKTTNLVRGAEEESHIRRVSELIEKINSADIEKDRALDQIRVLESNTKFLQKIIGEKNLILGNLQELIHIRDEEKLVKEYKEIVVCIIYYYFTKILKSKQGKQFKNPSWIQFRNWNTKG